MNKRGIIIGVSLFVLLAILIISLLLGVGSIIGTLALITSVGWIFLSVIKRLSKKLNANSQLSYKLQLGVSSLLLTWFIAELILRYGVSTYANYSEKNGGFFYVSPYLVKESSWSSVWQKDEHVYKPNYEALFNFKEYAYQLVTNSDGFRDKEYNSEDGAGKFNVFTLGDSFTEGRGVAMDASWPQLLGRELTGLDSPRKFHVVNAGISGSDPVFELFLLQNSIEKYNPELVIVAINNSDIDDIIVRGGLERYDQNGMLNYVIAPWWIGFYANSFLIRHIAHDVLNYNWLLIKEDQMEQCEMKAKEQMLACLKKFESCASSNQFKLLFVFHPTLEEMNSGRLELEPIIAELEASSNASVFNLLEYFIQHGQPNAPENYYWPIDRHHNEIGYRLFAEGIKQHMVASGLVN